MNKINIKDLYLIFGNEKQKALRLLKEGKSKSEILKAAGCTIAVRDANLSIDEGEIFVIMGLSGSGKSTLWRCINRLIKPTSGEVIINGTDISKVSDKELLQIRRKELAMVFQNFGLLPHRTVLHNIAFGLELQGVKREERERKAMESMQLVGLKGYENQMVGELSGGERGRLHLAKLLQVGGNMLLLDEPTNDLDIETLRALENALLEFPGCAMVISHDRWFLDRIATHILDYQDEGKVEFFEGNFTEYEEYKKRTLGADALEPKRIKYKRIAK